VNSPLRLGLIVNPIAGMGGAVALQGTDSPEALREALRRGAVPHASARAAVALETLLRTIGERLALLAGAGEMGESAAERAGLAPLRIIGNTSGTTTAADTRHAARAMRAEPVDLLLFAGGDGTARDICEAIGEDVAAIGIPAGVKMHSGVFAASPRAAGDLAARFLRERIALRPVEVMDIDEEAYRSGEISARLFGYLAVPFDRALVQGVKVGRVSSDARALAGIAAEVAERLRPGQVCVLGPGTTTRAIARRLGVAKTLLGVDVVRDGTLLRADADAAAVREAVAAYEALLVVSPIGGQGHIFGRGNQQLGPDVLRQIGRAGLLVVATLEKLASLHGRPLCADTGDADLDRAFAGYVRVITGYRCEAVYPLSG
jgi:predicted polyphosphate/ATP-dependent NAD kinase